jgi:hypothetical protein
MKRLFLALVSASAVAFSFPLVANIGPQGFDEFRQAYFIETGTFGGDGIQKALNAGFRRVRSMEFDTSLANDARRRFVKNRNVTIYQGDSSLDLWKIIKDINEPVTFWLDAHIFPPREDGGKNCPLIEELEQIKQHPIKTHTILIDDMHCCNTAAFDFMNQDDFIQKILEINPDYEIRYVDGGDEGEYKNNVMVATCPSGQ